MCQSLSRVAHISPIHGNVHQHHGKVPLDEEKVPPLSHGTNPAAWLGRLAFGGICTRKPPSLSLTWNGKWLMQVKEKESAMEGRKGGTSLRSVSRWVWCLDIGLKCLTFLKVLLGLVSQR